MLGGIVDSLLNCATIICLTGFLVTSALYTLQRRLIYFPTHGISRIPSDYNLQYKDVLTKTRDGETLHSWLITTDSNSESAPTILFLHGNAGEIGSRLQNAERLVHNINCNVFLLSYRGFGNSTGTPTEQGLVMDAQSALEYLSQCKEINQDRLFVFGRSLGGAVALGLAAESPQKIKAIILENTFTSIPAIGVMYYPFVKYFPDWMIKDKWNSLDKITKVQIPIAFISGQQDEIVPKVMMEQLYQRATNAAKRVFISIDKGRHLDCWIRPGYFSSFRDFVNDVCAQ